MDEFDMHAEERLWPTVEGDEEGSFDPDGYPESESFGLEDDADALASAGMGTDEDYGSFGGEDDWLDGSYEE